jgi:hypothetical protein
MPEPKKTKGGGKDEGGTPTIPTPEELAKQAEGMPIAGHLARMMKQDRLDGVDEDHLPYEQPEDEYFVGGDRDDEAGPPEGSEGPIEPTLALAVQGEPVPGEASDVETGADVSGAQSDLQKVPAASTAHKGIVRAINNEVITNLETTAERIGNLGVETIGKGDARYTLSPNLVKSALYKLVANDPELMIDPRRLSEFMRASAFKRVLLQNGEDVSSLVPSKLIALLPVRDEALRIQLAREANERNYSVRQIRTLVKGFIPRKQVEDIGKTILKKLASPLQMLDDQELFTMCADRQLLMRDLSSAERRKILAQIKEGKPRLKALDALVETLQTTLEQIEEES